MRNQKTIVLPFVLIGFILLTSLSGHKAAYQFFNTKGKGVKYSKVIKKAMEADVILFGELHNSSICHWLQLQLTKDIHQEFQQHVVMGAEMFERDNQLLLDEYLDGLISKNNFSSQARLWPNYKTDYQPLIEFAKKNNLNFIATNIPRRYASIVSRKGFEGLDDINTAAKNYIAPLPIEYDPELKSYKAMLDMFKGQSGMSHMSQNFPKAQAIKDATMAWFIHQNYEKGQKFIHYHGTYHSNDFEGIYWYLKKYNPELNILNIASVEQEQLDSLSKENLGLADYILCIPEDMTKTH